MHARKTLINFFGLGAGSLTSQIYTYLRLHPEIFSPETPLNFFSDTKIYNKGVIWYENNFKSLKSEVKYGELSENYLGCIMAVPLIAHTYPNAKLFAVIDDPLIAVRVVYIEALKNKRIDQDTTLAQFLKRYPEVLMRFCFGKHLSQYFSYYSHNDLLVLIASEISEDPLKNISTLYKHLEIDANFVPLVLKHLVPIEEEDPKKRGGIIKRSIKFVVKFIKSEYANLLKKFKAPKERPDAILLEAKQFALSPELEKFLRDYYRHDVMVLSSLLHRNFDVEWGFKESKVE